MEFKVTFANGRQTYVDADNEKELKSELDKLVKTFGSDVSKVSAMDEKFSIGGFLTGSILGGYFGNEVAKNGLQKTAKKTAKSVVSTSKRTFNKAKKEVAGFKKASTRKYATGGITKQADGTYNHPSGFKIEPYDEGRYILLDPDGMDAVGESMTLAEAKQTLLDNVESGHFKRGGKTPIQFKGYTINYINGEYRADTYAGEQFSNKNLAKLKSQITQHLISEVKKQRPPLSKRFGGGKYGNGGGVDDTLSWGFYVKINPYYTATIRNLKSFEEYLKRKDEIWGKEFGEITSRDKTASKEWVARLNELIAQKKAELHEHGSSKYKVGDLISIFRNQAERDAEVIAVSGNEILVEYTMPNGTSALNVIDTTMDDYRGKSGRRNYEPISYSVVKKSKKWASKINPERLVNNPQSGAKFGNGGGVGKYEYKTINTRSASGLKEAERLKAEGWKIISTGFDTIQFERLKTTKKMSTGGSAGLNTSDMNYNEILAVLKEKLDDAVQELPNDYEQSYDAKGEEVEHQSRDGFIAFTDGGYEVTWFEYMSMFHGAGRSLPTKNLDQEMQRQIDYNYQIAKERFVEEYPEIVEELGEDNIDYHSLYEAGYGSEAEQLSEWEMDFDGNETIMCEIGAYYYTPDNYRSLDGQHTIRLFGLVNLEAPYHRRGNLDDSYDIDITFNSISELKEKIDAGLIEIINWFNGEYYDQSDREMKIRKMKTGGSAGGVKPVTYYVANSSYFDSNKYDIEKMTKALKSIGATDIHTENDRGWSNQPEVVVFKFAGDGTDYEPTKAIQKAFDTDYIIVRVKDWRTKKFETGGGVDKTYVGGNLSEYELQSLNSGIRIKALNDLLMEKFPDAFGLEIYETKNPTQYRNLTPDKEPYGGIKNDDLKVYFDKHHSLHYSIYQGGENTYFNFALEGNDNKGYIGTFGFKDEGDVQDEYVTSFVVFLHKVYGQPFKVNHEVYANGGGVGSINVGDKVNLYEIKMPDGRTQFERVERGEVLYINDGIYGVKNPKTNRIHQVRLDQIESCVPKANLGMLLVANHLMQNRQQRLSDPNYRSRWEDRGLDYRNQQPMMYPQQPMQPPMGQPMGQPMYARGGSVGSEITFKHWDGSTKTGTIVEIFPDGSMDVSCGFGHCLVNPSDVVGAEKMARGSKVSEYYGIKENNVITERQMNLIKNRLNAGKKDAELEDIVQYIWDNAPNLTPDQNKKGHDFLMNLWKSPTGKERVNNPFGYREQEALEQFDHFALAGFHDTSRYGQAPYYIPLYDVYMKDGEYGFQYYYNGEVSIVGAKGMKVPSKAYRNNLSRMSKSELLDYCKKNNIPCASGWDKDQILDIIDDVKQSRYGKGGKTIDERMYNFLEEDLSTLEQSIQEHDQETIEKFFSYWIGKHGHLKSLKTNTNERMYNFLEEDLSTLEQSIQEHDQETIEKFFSYWRQHLSSIKFAKGGSTAGWHRDRKFVDKGAKHEVRYAKSNSGRSGYKSNEEFGVGGGVRTNSKEVREKVRKHILDSVYDYEENQFPNFQDASQHLTDEFKRVADHPYNLKRFPNNQKRFQDYLQGIPFNFEFENYKIEEFLNGLGINPTGKEYSSDQMWHLYSYLIWREVEPTYQSKKFSGGGGIRKAPFKVGDMVYSYQNPNHKMRVSFVEDRGIIDGVDYGWGIKVALKTDADGKYDPNGTYSQSSKWMSQNSVSKTKKEKYETGGIAGSKFYVVDNRQLLFGSSKPVVATFDTREEARADAKDRNKIYDADTKMFSVMTAKQLKSEGVTEFGGGGTTDNPKEPIAFETSNLYFNGKGMDVNGNKVVRVSFPNSRAFSIQTNGNLPKTHSMSKGGYDEKEINQYVKEYGSDAQKKKLKCY
jgi:hypothetical protein